MCSQMRKEVERRKRREARTSVREISNEPDSWDDGLVLGMATQAAAAEVDLAQTLEEIHMGRAMLAVHSKIV